MSVYCLQATQKIPVTIREAWDFFSRPENLKTITPAYMGFSIRSSVPPGKMYAGQLIEYTVKPIARIPMYWMTEITNVNEQSFFADEQRFGPYRFWHHQHHFLPVDGGTEMTDIVHYKIPLWILGDAANRLLVRKQLKNIFEYRFRKTETLFGAWPGGQALQITIR